MLDIAASNSIVAIQLKKAITQKGLKQASIASKAGYSAQELNDMLNGRRIMRAVDIASIINVMGEFGVDANYLFGIEKGAEEKVLKNIPTKELVEELKKREGVKAEYAEPYQDTVISINGPAVILIVID